MLPICYICLRSNIKLLAANKDDLDTIHDELCNNNIFPEVQFCVDCIMALQRYNKFKKKCQVAFNMLRDWKQQKPDDRKPICLLYTDLPVTPPHLSRSDLSNFRVFVYQPTDVNLVHYNHTLNSKYSHILTLDIPATDGFEIKFPNICQEIDTRVIENTVKVELKNKNDTKIETVMLEHNIDDEEFEEERIKSEPEDADEIEELVKNKISDSDHNKGLTVINKLDDNCSDSNDSCDEILANYKSYKEEKKKTKSDLNREDVKARLKKKFEEVGVVKDEDGTVINVDAFLNNLDTYSSKQFVYFRDICKDREPFSASAIRKMSKIQNRFSGIDSVISIEYLSDPVQIKAEFERRRQYPDYLKFEHHCEQCIKGFKYEKLLDYHNKVAHDASQQIECPLCHMRFKSKLTFNRHYMNHTTVYRCKICPGFVNNHRTSMISHYQTHAGVQHTCEHCGVKFKFKSALFSHYNKTHGARHACEFCARAFSKVKGLKAHKRRKHDGEEFVPSEHNRKCDECDVTFANDDVYNKHLEITHTNNEGGQRRKFPCDICDHSFKNPWHRRQHYLKEHPQVECKTQNAKRYLCDHCGKGFQKETTYKDHLNTHTGALPYSCTHCPKKFTSKINMKVHLERHLPPKRSCAQCGKMFRTAHSLYAHMRIHEGDRRYVCDICDKGFLFSTALKGHIEGVHHNVRRKKRQLDE